MIPSRALILTGSLLAAGGGAAIAQAPQAPRLALPIACQLGKTCDIQNYVDRDPGAGASDYQCGSRSYDAHSGIDFRLPDLRAQQRGVDVLAAADGRVARVRDGIEDISVRDRGPAAVANQECGNGLVIDHAGGLSTQYCHMAKNSLAVKPGDPVKAGARLGRVGLSGNTEYPHLHFTVRRNGQIIDPFAPEAKTGQGRCGGGEGLWRPDLGPALAYKTSSVLNAGFADRAPDMAAIEAGDLRAPTASSPLLIAYVRMIGSRAGDLETLTLTDPVGRVVAKNTPAPLPRHQAQRFIYVGVKRPAPGWTIGAYRASYALIRNGKVVAERQIVVNPTD